MEKNKVKHPLYRKKYQDGDTHKVCSTCQILLPFSDFFKSSTSKSGYQSLCKKCHKIKTDISINNDREKYMKRIRIGISKRYAGYLYVCIINRRKKLKQNYPICEKEDFKNWYNSQKLICVYCLETQEQSFEKYGIRLNTDRIVGELGYVVGNMCLACRRCNLVKNKFLTFDQMMWVAIKFFRSNSTT